MMVNRLLTGDLADGVKKTQQIQEGRYTEYTHYLAVGQALVYMQKESGSRQPGGGVSESRPVQLIG